MVHTGLDRIVTVTSGSGRGRRATVDTADGGPSVMRVTHDRANAPIVASSRGAKHAGAPARPATSTGSGEGLVYCELEQVLKHPWNQQTKA